MVRRNPAPSIRRNALPAGHQFEGDAGAAQQVLQHLATARRIRGQQRPAGVSGRGSASGASGSSARASSVSLRRRPQPRGAGIAASTRRAGAG